MKIRSIAIRVVIGIFMISILTVMIVAMIVYLPYILLTIFVAAAVAVVIFSGYVIGDGILYLIKKREEVNNEQNFES